VEKPERKNDLEDPGLGVWESRRNGMWRWSMD